MAWSGGLRPSGRALRGPGGLQSALRALDPGRPPPRKNLRRHAGLRRDQDRRSAGDRISAVAGDAGGEGSGEGEMRVIANSLRYQASRVPMYSAPLIHNILASQFRKTLVLPRWTWNGGTPVQPAGRVWPALCGGREKYEGALGWPGEKCDRGCA
jgi:hypothetical protein